MSRVFHDKVESHVKTREPYDKTLFGIRGEFKHSQPTTGALCAPVFVTIFLIVILTAFLYSNTTLTVGVKAGAIMTFLVGSAVYAFLMAMLCKKGFHAQAYYMLIPPLLVSLVFIGRKSAEYSRKESSKVDKECGSSGPSGV